MADDLFLEAPASIGPDPIVFYFHHIGRPINSHISISTQEFAMALDAIGEYGRIVPALPGAAGNRPAFSVTFDDGFADTLQIALPLIEARGMTCALFVNTATIGSRIEVHGARRPLAAITWADLATAHAFGHLIGSHGHHHVRWDRFDASTIKAEAEISIRLLQDRLGVAPFAFAYPYGQIPGRLPKVLGKHVCFATSRVPAVHWTCRPNAIRRVYLPARHPHDWWKLLERWSKAFRTANCEHCHRHARSMDGASVHIGSATCGCG